MCVCVSELPGAERQDTRQISNLVPEIEINPVGPERERVCDTGVMDISHMLLVW